MGLNRHDQSPVIIGPGRTCKFWKMANEPVVKIWQHSHLPDFAFRMNSPCL